MRFPRRPSSLAILALAVVLAIVYATLHPFSGWRPWSSLGAIGLGFFFEPWPRYWTRFDLLLNIAMYMPLGLLLALLLRRHLPAWLCALLALLAAAMLSLLLEWLQTLLPGRVPSRLDWAANTAGALAGITLAFGIERLAAAGAGRWIATLRHRLPFDESAELGIALLLAWLVAQAAPQVIGFGTGRLGDAALLVAGIDPALIDAWRIPARFARLAEGVGVFMTVVAIGALVRSITHPAAPCFAITVAVLLAAAAVRAAGARWLPDAQAPFGWLSAATQGGLLVSLPALLACGWLARRHAILIGLVALVAATALHNLTPANEYQRSMLAAADQGEWANITALIGAIGFAWPYAAITFLAARISAPGGPPTIIDGQ
ncbi:MAG: VanZ family protein [Burkholderiaceae bacterium]